VNDLVCETKRQAGCEMTSDRSAIRISALREGNIKKEFT
jgi:hypothetical protein